MSSSQQCPICDSSASIMFGSPANRVDCVRCGQYEQGTPWSNIADIRHRIVLSGWVREQNAAGSVPSLTKEVIDLVTARPRPDLTSRAMLLLRQIAQLEGALRGGHLSNKQIVESKKTAGITYSLDATEIHVLLQLLEFEKLVSWKINPEGIVLTIPGILAVEKMSSTGAEFAQGFVAMWFNPELDAAWTSGFDPAIRKAGYRPFRIDKKEYIGGITDEIIAEIRRSRFVVVDYTEQANGAYFEAGFALGLGLAVIPTCRADQIGKLHFDIRHLNTLPWGSPEDLSANLSKRIIAILGPGPF
jgi:hypothetical protein